MIWFLHWRAQGTGPGQRCSLGVAQFTLAITLAGSASGAIASDASVATADCRERIPSERNIMARREGVASPDAASTAQPSKIAIRVEPGDSLDAMFTKRGLSRYALYNMLKNREAAKALRDLRPGDRVQIEVADDRLSRLEYQRDPWRYLEVVKKGGEYQTTWVDTCPGRRVGAVSIVVTSSLYDAGRAVGLSSRLVLRLVDIFSPVMDLSRRLHPGDRVSVVYEEVLRDGRRTSDGAVLAAEVNTKGRKVRLFRHSDGVRVTYFRANGSSVLGARFARPIPMAKIRSGFTKARRHPVLGRVRAHKGLDFGARSGTPILATADGRIGFKGRQRGYGNTIILDHGAGHQTLYAHLSRFSPRLRQDRVIQEGDIIGYVGRTGLASGPNLHYEVRVDGVPVDPRRHVHDNDSRISSSELRDFNERIQPLVEQLDTLSPSEVDRSA